MDEKDETKTSISESVDDKKKSEKEYQRNSKSCSELMDEMSISDPEIFSLKF